MKSWPSNRVFFPVAPSLTGQEGKYADDDEEPLPGSEEMEKVLTNPLREGALFAIMSGDGHQLYFTTEEMEKLRQHGIDITLHGATPWTPSSSSSSSSSSSPP